jgi:hypothetical protein
VFQARSEYIVIASKVNFPFDEKIVQGVDEIGKVNLNLFRFG